jgi:hypothetical protein
MLPAPPPPSETFGSAEETILEAGGTSYSCTVQSVNYTENFEEMVLFATSNIDVIWPGSLVQTRHLSRGIPDPINMPRTPLSVWVDRLSRDNARLVENPTAASINSAVSDILISNPDAPTAAILTSSYVETHSLEQAALKMGFSAGFSGFKTRASFSSQKSAEERSLFIKVVQKYYTAAVDAPTSPASYLDPTVTASNLAPYVGEGNPPAYIASVTYGRILLFKMTSSTKKSYREMEASFKFKAWGARASGYTEQQLSETAEESRIELLVLGGSARDAAKVITTGEVKEYIENGANFSSTDSPGVPISYTVRYLRNNELVKLGATTEFQIWNCQENVQRVQVTMEKLEVHSDCDRFDTDNHGPGEFYYKLTVVDHNGVEHEVAANKSDLHVDSGSTRWIGTSKEILISKVQGAVMIVKGVLTEDDKDGKVEYVGDFRDEFAYGTENWVDGPKKHFLTRHEHCRVTFHYRLTFLP